ncbi:MAG: uroporphyrinogen decarboxylase family protein [Bifidobacterium psychraerophilum]|uniref:uroporphyrinogen decarboxylase family protein n=1 Tax=Bifidobacterium psychraerophilum TaxID=218140 RepID=UPI0039EA1E1F
MTDWTKLDRLKAVFAGEHADRPPVSAYTHEIAAERTGEDLAKATVAYQRKWDWDWVKLNPRTVHYAEAWGNSYDYDNYPVPGLPIPAQSKASVSDPKDLWNINELDVDSNPFIQEQIKVIRDVKAGAPDTPVFATLYSPVNVLAKIAGIPSWGGTAFGVPGSANTRTFADYISEDRAGVHHALHAIAETLAAYAEAQRKAGADGLVFVIATLTDPSFFSEAEFNEFSRAYDAVALDGASGSLRLVHTCGASSHPEWFQSYPLEGINWDHEDSSNSSIGAPLSKTKVGGVSHLLLAQEPDEQTLQNIRGQVTSAREATDDILVVAPTCSVSSAASDEALSAYKQAAEE